MVCQECGINTALIRGHSSLCSQYTEPTLSDAELFGLDNEKSDKLEAFGEAINDAVVERGEKTLVAFLEKIGIDRRSPGFDELSDFGRASLAVGSGITVQVLIEQGLVDIGELRRAAGV